MVPISTAMASGAVVISTRHAGIPDAVESGADGLLVAEGDLAGYKAALAAVLGDDALRLRLAEAARRRAVEKFDTRVLHRKVEEVILAAVRR